MTGHTSGKGLAQRHETNHSPWHILFPLSIAGRIMSVITEKVLPMSPVHLLPMSPVYTPGIRRTVLIIYNAPVSRMTRSVVNSVFTNYKAIVSRAELFEKL